MKGSKATGKMGEDWKRGIFNVKSHKKINLRKKVETTSLKNIILLSYNESFKIPPVILFIHYNVIIDSCRV